MFILIVLIRNKLLTCSAKWTLADVLDPARKRLARSETAAWRTLASSCSKKGRTRRAKRDASRSTSTNGATGITAISPSSASLAVPELVSCLSRPSSSSPFINALRTTGANDSRWCGLQWPNAPNPRKAIRRMDGEESGNEDVRPDHIHPRI